jgi:hypothetical protein
MIKLGGTTGSGAKTYFNGWINIFFPYMKTKMARMVKNNYVQPYSSKNGYAR